MQGATDNDLASKSRHHVPMRTCIACGKKTSSSKLLRVARAATGEITLDPKRRLPGRGAHVCKMDGCIHRAVEKRLFCKAFKTNIDKEKVRALFIAFYEIGCVDLKDEHVNRALGE